MKSAVTRKHGGMARGSHSGAGRLPTGLQLLKGRKFACNSTPKQRRTPEGTALLYF